ncbi:DMT family transporter [Paenirhodobacter enshiensis]|uniref:Peptide ABC transporter permease n=1 Tax=Paenirhodobacter enshiensis TaxID=1105367 RepID=A0A086Y3Y4_9RHOB|nr:DMT family transporter [Paenirhodobacter enshiensis]KFI28984.1 peptide ABC transporter permease [Paenirhodobacter enshiensis]
MDLRAIGMGLAFALMWSSAFTSARMIVVDAPPLLALSLRFLFSGLIGCGIAAAMGQTWRLSRAQWKSTLIFGLCQNALYLGLNFVAMQRVGASVASIIASTMPLIVALLGWAVFRDRIRPLAIAGLIAGVLGVALIMGARLSGGVDPVGVALCFGGALALAIATLSVRGAASGGNVLMIVGLQMFVGAAILIVVSAFTEDWSAIEWSQKLVWAFIYTTLIPGVLATWVWFRLVGRIGAIKAATFHFLNPFFGVAIAALVLGEKLGPLDLVGVAIITAGILAVQLSKGR